MRLTRLCVIALALLLCITVAAGANEPLRSPLTSVIFTWQSAETVGLPWYPVAQDEIEICSRGLTSNLGASNDNDVFEANLFTPIYMDTITLLAKKSPVSLDNGQEGTYYEVGWYVQPFADDVHVNITLGAANGRTFTLAAGQATKGRAFDGYVAFPVPCDPKTYIGKCKPDIGPLSFARLEWWTSNGTIEGPRQSIRSNFILVNPENE